MMMIPLKMSLSPEYLASYQTLHIHRGPLTQAFYQKSQHPDVESNIWTVPFVENIDQNMLELVNRPGVGEQDMSVDGLQLDIHQVLGSLLYREILAAKY